MDENECNIPLADVVEQLAHRLIEFLHLENLELNFLLKLGFDGTQLKSYKIKFQNENSNDNQILCTSLVPLQLIDEDSGRIYWLNENSSSTRVCTCFHLQYIRKAKEACLREKKYIDDQISLSQPIEICGSSVEFRFDCTMLDGKVCNFLIIPNVSI